MAEDVSILSEIDEALRADRLAQFWAHYSSAFITFCICAILATAASTYWKNHLHEERERETGLLWQGVALAQTGKNSEAVVIYEKLEQESGPVATLAALRHAQALIALKQEDKALALYNDIASGKGDAPKPLRDYARLEAGILAYDTSQSVKVGSDAKPADSIFSQSVAEAQALEAIKAGDVKNARTLLAGIVADPTASLNARTRAAELLATLKEDKK